jgi:ribosome biogenesis GTPase
VPVGQVIRSHSNIHHVLIEGQEIECRPRGRLRLDKQDVLVGDQVEVHLEDGEGRIDRVLPRRSVLQRPSVANVDLAVIIFTLKDPEVDLAFLDRVLVHAEQAGVEVVILLNKIDLLQAEEIEEFQHQYGKLVGYPVYSISAQQGIELHPIPALLRGRVSVLAGHSGVGKSHLIRALEPGRADVKVGELSVKLGRGKHTTRHVELISLSSGGLVADTPGFTYLELSAMEKRDLQRYFREFRPLAPSCRFDDCLHRAEPNCAVRVAVQEGQVLTSRYEHYLHFLKEVEMQKRW